MFLFLAMLAAVLRKIKTYSVDSAESKILCVSNAQNISASSRL